ncbi:unnamed protein product [Chrysodeixis includens]|uniref:Uncharacterized protein n=1 Tax=Chrysodeixis includens TaxID=689277 RepID=A0A9N8PWS0_CHRIL|nr:unnamed protein product [Chrysodeixis includens]
MLNLEANEINKEIFNRSISNEASRASGTDGARPAANRHSSIISPVKKPLDKMMSAAHLKLPPRGKPPAEKRVTKRVVQDENGPEARINCTSRKRPPFLVVEN